jgi:hypothetical protein
MGRGRKQKKSGGGELEVNKQDYVASDEAILLPNVTVLDEAILLPYVAGGDEASAKPHVTALNAAIL